MQLAGELSKISLPSLIQLVRNGGLTGEISLAQGTNNATIFVEQGRIIHVESDVGSGKEGFLELFLWLNGTFSFVESKLPDIQRTFSPDESIEKLLREGIAYLEEKKYLDQLRINGQTILKPTALAKSIKDIPLLERLDGRKTLAQALADANLSRRAYVKAVFQILSEGLVVVSEPVVQGDHVDLPGWVVSRLKQDNPNLSQAIVDMVIWVDRIKCWMYQADADLERVINDLGAGVDDYLAAQMNALPTDSAKPANDSQPAALPMDAVSAPIAKSGLDRANTGEKDASKVASAKVEQPKVETVRAKPDSVKANTPAAGQGSALAAKVDAGKAPQAKSTEDKGGQSEPADSAGTVQKAQPAPIVSPVRAARTAYTSVRLPVGGSTGQPSRAAAFGGAVTPPASPTPASPTPAAPNPANRSSTEARPGITTAPLAQPPAASIADVPSDSTVSPSSPGSGFPPTPPVVQPTVSAAKSTVFEPLSEEDAAIVKQPDVLPTVGATAPIVPGDQSASAGALPSWAEPSPNAAAAPQAAPAAPQAAPAAIPPAIPPAKAPSFTVARATPLPPPAGSGRASDLLKQQVPAPVVESGNVTESEPPVAQSPAVENTMQPAVAEEKDDPAETAKNLEEEPAVANDPPQAIPRAPWTRAAMARKGFLGGSGSGSKPAVPPRSIEF